MRSSTVFDSKFFVCPSYLLSKTHFKVSSFKPQCLQKQTSCFFVKLHFVPATNTYLEQHASSYSTEAKADDNNYGSLEKQNEQNQKYYCLQTVSTRTLTFLSRMFSTKM